MLHSLSPLEPSRQKLKRRYKHLRVTSLNQMKRVQEKIRDFVEPQVFDEVVNVAADPARSLAAYRFTDATSELTARWLDALADLPRGRGAARALAGSRGVGKSHALAVFSALAALPELRAAVAEAHVATSARRLMNRRYTVVRVERGTRATLLEELAAAFTEVFGGDEQQWGGDPGAMLAVAASRAHDATLVVIIDTAFGRATRVNRDDGPALSELAVAAQNTNAFIALALDDDIADASGINVRLSATFQIDYLDPEHLYRIVDLFLLRKTREARAALHDIYLSLRASVPGFNWSEPRFAALYPVHPLVADVAAAVRLYAPTFALLPFAAAAAGRAIGRPALSLILLDEVFDRAEYDLRKSEELRDAFAAYDDSATRGVQQLPVMQRLQSKLILKSLFIFSLDGHGATAKDLCAALLFGDEATPAAEVTRIDEMLARFAETAPAGMWERIEDGVESRYRFKISAAAGFESALAASVEQMASGHAPVGDLLRTVARVRFDDWPLSEASGDNETLMDAGFEVSWRGTDRPGRLIWQPAIDAPLTANTFESDWEILLLAPANSDGRGGAEGDGASAEKFLERRFTQREQSDAPPISVVWQPAELNPDELLVLRRLLALRNDAALAANFGDKARVAAVALQAQVGRIWTRIYMDRGALIVDGEKRAFTDGAHAASSLTAALASFLTPLFEEHYPEHPAFTGTLGEEDVARLMEGLLGGADVAEEDMQVLIRQIALPLGLAVLRGQTYTLETGDEALGHAWMREVLELTDRAEGGVVPLETIRRALSREPYGFSRKTRHLILAALVAQRRVELVTASGDRINRRTLGRSVNWEEVTGVCRSAGIHHSAEKLTAWARLLTNQPALGSITDPEAREAVRATLSAWLDKWHAQRVLENFSGLPDEGLTTRAWSLAAAVRKSFGAASSAVETALAGEISLEEGLQRIADAFRDSPDNFATGLNHLADVVAYTTGLKAREKARVYLFASETTFVDEIESARRELLSIAEDVHTLFDRERRARFDLLWRAFHKRYVEHYVAMHDGAVGTASDRRPIDTLMRSDEWHEFEALSQLSIMNHQYWADAEALVNGALRARCELPVRGLLIKQPRCVCSFRLSHTAAHLHLRQELEDIVDLGRGAYRRTLLLFRRQLQYSLDALAAETSADSETAERAHALSSAFAQDLIPRRMTRADIRLLARAIETMAAPPPVRVHLPTENCGLLTREELSARLRQWLDGLPDHSVFFEVVGEGEGDAA